MSGIVNKIKDKLSSKDASNDAHGENAVSIQPHPAKSNDPADLAPQTGGGLNSDHVMGAHHARDPYVPSQELKNNLEEPLSRDELKVKSAELN